MHNTAKIQQHGGKFYKIGKFSTVHDVMFKKSVFLKAFSELFFVLSYLRNQTFLMPFLSYFFETSPSLGSLSAISLCEFAAIRLSTFLSVDGLETKSPHCYKCTDTDQLINHGPNMPQSQMNIKAYITYFSLAICFWQLYGTRYCISQTFVWIALM